MVPVVIMLSGVMGACGVGLAAAAAHLAPGGALDSAATMLLLHAVAILGAAALLHADRLSPWPAYLALAGWLVGSTLFAGDIALRTFTGARLFPMAAPTGGTLLIAAWLALTAAAIGGARRPRA